MAIFDVKAESLYGFAQVDVMRADLCDDSDVVEIYGDVSSCSAVCPNRTMVGGFCVLKCLPDKPLMDAKGKCHACDDKLPLMIPECQQLCPNRKLKNSFCIIECPSDKPLMDEDGNCHACDDIENVEVHLVKENCMACSNRVLINGGNCVLSCPPD